MSARGLSCFTANLHGYLAREWDADALIAASVRLAVRAGAPGAALAFSHHAPSLERLPDGSRLIYVGAGRAEDLLPAVEAELEAYHRVLVVVDSANLPWSIARGGQPAPHWLLVDDRGGAGWHVVDEFTALLPSGEQPAHTGWLSPAELRAALALPESWAPEQADRLRLAFGTAVAVPPGRALFLRRDDTPAPEPGQAEGCWLVGYAETLPYLSEYLAAHPVAAARYVDDLWAAAGHRAFAHRWRLATPAGQATPAAVSEALARWESLPRLVRLAVESAQRGRPRPTLTKAAFAELLHAEEAIR